MPKVILVCGNDGSGKTTYVQKLINEYREKKSKVLQRHYYENPFRRFLRRFVSSNKGERSISENRDQPSKSFFLSAAYMIYALSSVIAIKLEKIFSRKYDAIIYDRCFIDELISIETHKKIFISDFVYNVLINLSDYDDLYYLDADSKVKYNRIEDLDISYSSYLLKEEKYKKVISLIESKQNTGLIKLWTDGTE